MSSSSLKYYSIVTGLAVECYLKRYSQWWIFLRTISWFWVGKFPAQINLNKTEIFLKSESLLMAWRSILFIMLLFLASTSNAPKFNSTRRAFKGRKDTSLHRAFIYINPKWQGPDISWNFYYSHFIRFIYDFMSYYFLSHLVCTYLGYI